MLNWYMQLPRIQKQKSYNRKVNACTHLLEYFGNIAVHSVESEDIERYRDARGAAPNTINVEVAVLSGAFTAAKKAKKIHADMRPGEFFIEEDNNRRPTVTEEQYKKLLKHSQPDFTDILVCGYESAMRSGEIANLRAYQVHLDVAHISGALVDYIDLGIFDTKNSTRRSVPVSEALKDLLKRRRRAWIRRIMFSPGRMAGPGMRHRSVKGSNVPVNVPRSPRVTNYSMSRVSGSAWCSIV
jgi:integrase